MHDERRINLSFFLSSPSSQGIDGLQHKTSDGNVHAQGPSGGRH